MLKTHKCTLKPFKAVYECRTSARKDNMIIKLNDSYYIDQDDLCYTLKTVKTSYGSGNHKSELPKMRTVVCGYFMTLENALRRFAELQVRDGLETTECDCSEVADRIRTIMNNAVERMEKLCNSKT